MIITVKGWRAVGLACAAAVCWPGNERQVRTFDRGIEFYERREAKR